MSSADMASGEASGDSLDQLQCFLTNCKVTAKVLQFEEDSFESCHKALHVRKVLQHKYSDIYLPSQITHTCGYHSECKKRFTALKKEQYEKCEKVKPYRRSRGYSSSRSISPATHSRGPTPHSSGEDTNESTVPATERYLYIIFFACQ